MITTDPKFVKRRIPIGRTGFVTPHYRVRWRQGRPAGNGVFKVTSKSAAERLEDALLGDIQIERTCPLNPYSPQKRSFGSLRSASDGRVREAAPCRRAAGCFPEGGVERPERARIRARQGEESVGLSPSGLASPGPTRVRTKGTPRARHPLENKLLQVALFGPAELFLDQGVIAPPGRAHELELDPAFPDDQRVVPDEDAAALTVQGQIDLLPPGQELDPDF